MLEKRNKRLFILLVVLVAATLTVYWYGGNTEGSLVNKDIFKDYDLGSIDQITLATAKDTVTLKFTGSRWQVNSAFPADREMIEVLFATLQQAEPRRPVASSMRDSIADEIQQKGVKVSLSAQGEVQKMFFVGGNDVKNQAYFFDLSSGESFLMTIPGYRVYVAGIFELDDDGWRDKFVFGFNWRNFQRLQMEFAGKPNDDFEIAMENGYFGILGLPQADTTKVNDFLDNVSLLTVSGYLRASLSLDSLGKSVPEATLLVQDVAKNEYRLELYATPQSDRQYPGRINGSQWALFEESQIAGVLRPRGFFAK